MRRRIPLAFVAALACAAGDAEAACPTSEPILGPLTCSSVASGRLLYTDTSSSLGGAYTSGNSYQCSTGDIATGTSQEDVYEFSCAFDGTVTLEVSGLDCDLDFFVLESSCDPDPDCIGDSIAVGASDTTVNFSCVAGDVYYIVVEGYGFTQPASYPFQCSGASEGDYTLSFDTTPGGACGEDCGNGLDDDSDGYIDCGDPDCTPEPECVTDADGDGYDGVVYGGTDCDDTRASVNPGATEICDSLDNDCDGTTDEASASGAPTWYRDADGDSYGNASSTTRACTQPSGYVSNSTDCDDTRSTIYPGASETCDGYDNDCDGATDESGGSTWYRDADGDGYGTSTSTTVSCSAPSGYVSNSSDCNDSDAAISPADPEICNSVDDDCDGSTDESGGSTWYADADSDGYGEAASTRVSCSMPTGYVSNSTDCNDRSSTVHPGATEYCNGTDDDCDGSTDEAGAADESTWYRDADGDGYGLTSSSTRACDLPTGYSATSGDCNDAEADSYPGNTEVCDGIDNDCDARTDESGGTSWYADTDGDGYGNASVATVSCTAPSGYVSVSTDCDDSDSAVYPGAPEYCNGADDNCDGTTDESTAVDATTWYADDDGDTYGDPLSTRVGCSAPSGYVDNADDCYDGDASVRPGGTETADGVDEDCDGGVDEGTSAYDDDGDGWSEDGGDCDDTRASARPGAAETCDGADEDCDGLVDEGTSCSDDDGDGVTEDGGDCNDGDASVSPEIAEVAENGVDDDCDGAVDSGIYDPDFDGYTVAGGDCGESDATTFPGATELPDGVDNDCDGLVDEGTVASDDDGDGFSENDGDCNDADPEVNPSATELTNGVDDDCDGMIDQGGPTTDDDGDGFSENAGDCDDSDAAIGPASAEVPNGLDDDCDEQIDEGTEDVDGDGYAVADGDCDDSDGWANPGLAEHCGDEIDNNCNGEIDEGCGLDTGVKQDTGGGVCGGCNSRPAGHSAVALLLGLVALTLRRRST